MRRAPSALITMELSIRPLRRELLLAGERHTVRSKAHFLGGTRVYMVVTECDTQQMCALSLKIQSSRHLTMFSLFYQRNCSPQNAEENPAQCVV